MNMKKTNRNAATPPMIKVVGLASAKMGKICIRIL